MRVRVSVLGVLACLALAAGCGSDGAPSYAKPFSLPVGPATWDDVTAPTWAEQGTLHVGKQTVELGDGVDSFVLGATGAYWMRGNTLMFTSTRGRTQKVAEVQWNNLAVSADRSVFATVDQSRGPTDRYGAHVLQVAAFDTRTGEQLYRTPDAEPDKRDDLGALYPEIMPLLNGVSDERLFFANTTIDLRDGSTTPVHRDADRVDTYQGEAETLFLDGYRVGIRGEGRHRELSGTDLYGVGRLSPDRSTIFDVGSWPTAAVVYDAKTGDQREIDAPWEHFSLAGWSDEDTFFGLAERIDDSNDENVVRDRQVVTCELRTLRCTGVSKVIPTVRRMADDSPQLLLEGHVDEL